MKMHLLFTLLMTSIGFSPVHATSFNIRPFSEFTQSAPNVVRGILSNVHTENAVTNDGGKTIYTYANVAVKEVLKGNIQSSNIVIRKLGGTKDGTTLDIPSSPDFVENEDSVLFLSAEKDDRSYEVMGLELGKFGLEEKNGAMILTGGLFNYSQPHAHAHHPGEAQSQAGDLTENQRPWSLAQLRELIQQQGASPASAPSASHSEVQPSAQVSATPAMIEADSHTHDSHSNSSTSDEQPTSIPYWIGGALLIALIFFIWKRK